VARAVTRAPSQPERKTYLAWVIFLLFWVQALNIVDRHVFGLAIRGIKAEFGLSDQWLGALAGFAFALFYSVAGIPVARWADRGVRRDIVALSLLLWSAMTAACGLAQSAWQLALARVLVGVGEAGGSPPTHSLVTDSFPLERRGRALGLVSMGGSVGILISLLAGGYLAEHWGWRSAFLAMGTPGIALAALIRLTLREPPRGRFDAPSMSSEPATLPLREVIRALARTPSFLHISLAGSLYSLAGYGASIWNPSFLARVHGFDMAHAGLELGLRNALFAIPSVLAGGFLGDRLARCDLRWYQWMPALAGLAHFPFALAFLLWPDANQALWFLVPASLLGGLWAAPGHAMVQSLARPEMRATASALMLLLFNLIGFGLGPWVVGLTNDLLAARFGAESVRYSLVLIALAIPWAAAHNALAARTLARDLRAVARAHSHE
jgi:MFS family permease